MYLQTMKYNPSNKYKSVNEYIAVIQLSNN